MTSEGLGLNMIALLALTEGSSCMELGRGWFPGV